MADITLQRFGNIWLGFSLGYTLLDENVPGMHT